MVRCHMMEGDMKNIVYRGITVKTDIGLYIRRYGNTHTMVLLSIYGSPQQTKAVFSALASGREITLMPDGIYLDRPIDSTLRARGWSMGYGKHHMIIWDDEIYDMAVWFDPSDRLRAFEKTLKNRKIPYSPEYLPELEKSLLEEERLVSLDGYGGIQGYKFTFTDDHACNLMVERVIPSCMVLKHTG